MKVDLKKKEKAVPVLKTSEDTMAKVLTIIGCVIVVVGGFLVGGIFGVIWISFKMFLVVLGCAFAGMLISKKGAKPGFTVGGQQLVSVVFLIASMIFVSSY